MLSRILKMGVFTSLCLSCSDTTGPSAGDLAGSWSITWEPMSRDEPNNQWICTQNDTASLTIAASTLAGEDFGGEIGSVLLHCIGGPAAYEFDAEFGNTTLSGVSLRGKHVTFLLGDTQIEQQGEATATRMQGTATWTFVTPFASGVTETTLTGTWSATKDGSAQVR